MYSTLRNKKVKSKFTIDTVVIKILYYKGVLRIISIREACLFYIKFKSYSVLLFLLFNYILYIKKQC